MAGPWMISVSPSRWRLVDLSSSEARGIFGSWEDQQSPAQRAQCLAEAMEACGNEDPRALLALASSQCLAAQIDTEGVERTGRRRSMSFRLEEHLPLSAEDSVADFSEYARGFALGVCCRLADLQGLIEALESKGIEVASAAPQALLAAQAVVERIGGADAIVLHSTDGDAEQSQGVDLDWVELEQGLPRRWCWFSSDLRSCQAQLDRWVEERPGRLVLVESKPAIQAPEGLESVHREAQNSQALAPEQAGRILRGQVEPWVELRRGPLAAKDRQGTLNRKVSALVAVATVLLISLSAVFYWRGQQYDDLRSRYVREQIDAFRRAVPDQAPPLDVRGRMHSELRKLAGLRGRNPDDARAATSGQISAMVHLCNVLAHLPRDVRFQILKFAIGPKEIQVTAQGRNFAEADRVALSLQSSGLYDVEMHETNAAGESRVRFSFSARPSEGFESARGGQGP